DEVAFLGGHPGGGVRGRRIPAVLFEQVPKLADRSVLVVGQDVDDEGRTARAVSFVLSFLVGDAGLLAGPAPNRPLDVVGRHVVLLGVGDDRPQPRVHVGVPAAGAGGYRQLLDEARENLPALG